MAEENKKRKKLIILMLCLFAVGMILVSYAFAYDITYIGQNRNEITTCSFSASFNDENPIQLSAAYPISDQEGNASTPYTFYIRANNSNCPNMTYNVNLNNACDRCQKNNGICVFDDVYNCNCNSGSQIDGSLINYKLTNTRTNETLTGTNPYDLTITNAISGGVTDTYELRMWIDDTADEEDLYIYENNLPVENEDGTIQTKSFCSYLSINNTTRNLDGSGANVPELAEGMIPVYYDETVAAWRKADKANADSNNQWYSYASEGADKGMWANAVTVQENSSATSLTLKDDTTKPCSEGVCTRKDYIGAAKGTIIPMEDINTMWVWIPRFSAVRPSGNNGGTAALPGAIDLTFVNKNTEGHDAFWFDDNNDSISSNDEQLSGIWIGKFEDSATVIPTALDSTQQDIIIKPNVASWRYSNISGYYYATLKMKNPGNMYGFNNIANSNLDTHMIKNNEWGAVAYLTQSIYGRCSSETSCTEVSNNDCTTYMTGIGGNSVSAYGSSTTCTTAVNKYNGETGVLASTTGTVYGIYDMSAGSYEFVMANYNNTTGSSGLVMADVEAKYKNVYTTTSAYTTNLYQHAIVETAAWYNDRNYFVDSSYLWITRGGCNGDSTASGLFNSDRANATYQAGLVSISSRAILIMK